MGNGRSHMTEREGQVLSDVRSLSRLTPMASAVGLISAAVDRLQSAKHNDKFILFFLSRFEQLGNELAAIDPECAQCIRELVIGHRCALYIMRKQYDNVIRMLPDIKRIVPNTSMAFTVLICHQLIAHFATGRNREGIMLLRLGLESILDGHAPLRDAEAYLRIAAAYAAIISCGRTKLSVSLCRVAVLSGVESEVFWRLWRTSPRRAIARVRNSVRRVSA